MRRFIFFTFIFFALGENHIKVTFPNDSKIRSKSYSRVLNIWFSKHTIGTNLRSGHPLKATTYAILIATTWFSDIKVVLKISVSKIYFTRFLFHKKIWIMPAMLLKMNLNTFSFKEVIYRVETCSLESKTFRSIYFPEIFSMVGSSFSPLNLYNNCFL